MVKIVIVVIIILNDRFSFDDLHNIISVLTSYIVRIRNANCWMLTGQTYGTFYRNHLKTNDQITKFKTENNLLFFCHWIGSRSVVATDAALCGILLLWILLLFYIVFVHSVQCSVTEMENNNGFEFKHFLAFCSASIYSKWNGVGLSSQQRWKLFAIKFKECGKDTEWIEWMRPAENEWNQLTGIVAVLFPLTNKWILNEPLVCPFAHCICCCLHYKIVFLNYL